MKNEIIKSIVDIFNRIKYYILSFSAKTDSQQHGNIWFTSDQHFGHDKEFIYKARGFDTIEDMNRAAVERWNEVVETDDIVYCLGDIALGDIKENGALDLIKQLKGHIILIIGNHDTNTRLDVYESCPNIERVVFGDRFKVGKRTYVLSHRPVYMGNVGEDKPCWCISGHTHNTEKFSDDYPMNYCVCVDAHNLYPVSLDQIEEDIKEYTQGKAEVEDKLLEPYLNMKDVLKETLQGLEEMK